VFWKKVLKKIAQLNIEQGTSAFRYVNTTHIHSLDI
jgi:hypothetical protein